MSEVNILNFADISIEELQKQPEFKNVKIKRRKFALNRQQRQELLEMAKQNYKHYLLITLQLSTGIRANELINLTISDFNYIQQTIDIRSRVGNQYVLQFKTKTESSNRTVPVPRSIAESLRLYIGKRKTGYIFESQKHTEKNKNRLTKQSYIRIVNNYAKRCKSIGTAIGSHCLRRTYASYLLSQNVKLEYISRALGHNSIQTTLKYLFEIEPADYQHEIRKAIKDILK